MNLQKQNGLRPRDVEIHELDAKNVQEQFVDFIAGEDFVDHPYRVIAVGRVQTGDAPAHPLLLAGLVDPTPIRVRKDGLVVELEAVIGDHRHPLPTGQRHRTAEEIAFQMRMADADVAGVMGVAPVVLGIEQQRFGAGVAGPLHDGVQVDLELPLRRKMERQLHHAVGLVRGNDPLPGVGRPERGQVGKGVLRGRRGGGDRRHEHHSSGSDSQAAEKLAARPPSAPANRASGGVFVAYELVSRSSFFQF